MSLSIEGPSKADIECHDNEDGTCRVTYKPTEPGTYIINIKFADEHVPGQYLVCQDYHYAKLSHNNEPQHVISNNVAF